MDDIHRYVIFLRLFPDFDQKEKIQTKIIQIMCRFFRLLFVALLIKAFYKHVSSESRHLKMEKNGHFTRNKKMIKENKYSKHVSLKEKESCNLNTFKMTIYRTSHYSLLLLRFIPANFII